MSVLVLCAANGGVGTTTTAAALGATWPAADVLVAELDASGGDLAAWCDVPDSSGAAALAAARWDGTPATLDVDCIARLGMGTPVLCAPTRRAAASAVCDQLAAPLLDCFAATSTALLVDAGAVAVGGPHWIDQRVCVVVVARQDAASPSRSAVALERAAELVDSLLPRSRSVLSVVVGQRPFSAPEVAAFLGVACWTIDDDPLGAHALASPLRRRGSSRHALLRSAAPIAAALAADLAMSTGTTATDATAQEASVVEAIA